MTDPASRLLKELEDLEEQLTQKSAEKRDLIGSLERELRACEILRGGLDAVQHALDQRGIETPAWEFMQWMKVTEGQARAAIRRDRQMLARARVDRAVAKARRHAPAIPRARTRTRSRAPRRNYRLRRTAPGRAPPADPELDPPLPATGAAA